MKIPSYKTIALLCTAALSSLAASANEGSSSSAGNGGQGVVCGTAPNETWMLRDLWEIENVGDRQHRRYAVTRSETPYQDQLQAAVEKVRTAAPDYAVALERTLVDIARPEVRQAVGANVDLPITQDLGFSVNGVTCRTVQLADYHMRLNVNTLFLDNEYIAQLSQTDRAALELHEAIYLIERENFGATTSEHTRLVVGMIMSDASITRQELLVSNPDFLFTNVRLTQEAFQRLSPLTNFYHYHAVRGRGLRSSAGFIAMDNLWNQLPPSTREEVLGNWRASVIFSHWILEPRDAVRSVHRIELSVTPTHYRTQGAAYDYDSHNLFVDPYISFSMCEGGETTPGQYSLLLTPSSCNYGEKLIKRGIFRRKYWRRESRRIFESGTTDELIRHIGGLTSVPSRNLLRAALECKLVTLEKDRLMCRFALNPRYYVVYEKVN